MKFLNKFIYIFLILFILFIFCKFGINNFVETFENNNNNNNESYNNQIDSSKISFSEEEYPLEVYPVSIKRDLTNDLVIYEKHPNRAFQIVENKEKIFKLLKNKELRCKFPKIYNRLLNILFLNDQSDYNLNNISKDQITNINCLVKDNFNTFKNLKGFNLFELINPLSTFSQLYCKNCKNN